MRHEAVVVAEGAGLGDDGEREASQVSPRETPGSISSDQRMPLGRRSGSAGPRRSRRPSPPGRRPAQRRGERVGQGTARGCGRGVVSGSPREHNLDHGISPGRQHAPRRGCAR